MGFNTGSALSMGLQGFMLTENPLLAGIAALSGGIGGGQGIAGTIGNGLLSFYNGEDEAFQLSMYGQQIQHQEQMQLQSEAFDEMMDEKSEQMREVNTLRDVQMAQRKADNEVTKKFIQSITE